jgi:tripartite-type tricarboxylate transporter receptor subunit TctC
MVGMGRFFARLGICGAGALLAVNAVSPARAEDDFAGREITLYVGSSPGGPYDAYGRLLARHLGRHIPGHPGVVVQNIATPQGRGRQGGPGRKGTLIRPAC